MTAKTLKTDKGFDFSKRGKVSAWISTHPYQDIPDEYFEEHFNKKHTRATNQWSANYQLRFFNPEQMETNGSQEGLVNIKQAAGECSFSASFMEVLLSKAKKQGVQDISWLILLYDFEFSAKLSGIDKDEYTQYLGAFNYDETADSLFEIDEG